LKIVAPSPAFCFRSPLPTALVIPSSINVTRCQIGEHSTRSKSQPSRDNIDMPKIVPKARTFLSISQRTLQEWKTWINVQKMILGCYNNLFHGGETLICVPMHKGLTIYNHQRPTKNEGTLGKCAHVDHSSKYLIHPTKPSQIPRCTIQLNYAKP
jgi:hypothetical protein